MSIVLYGQKNGLDADEVSAIVKNATRYCQDKIIDFRGETMLLTTALNRTYTVASGRANISVLDTLPQELEANTQYWVKTYNGQTLENGCFIIIVDNLKVAHYVGQSSSTPGEAKTAEITLTSGVVSYNVNNELSKNDIMIQLYIQNEKVEASYNITTSTITITFSADAVEAYANSVVKVVYF